MDMSDFAGMDSLANNVTAPPNKVKPIKPSKEDLYAYYHDGLQPPKPLAKRYSMEHIRWVLEELYHYKLVDITEYKGTRGYDNHKRYRIEDENGKAVIACCNLYHLGSFLESEGDYYLKKPKIIAERYKAEVNYFEWYGPRNRMRPIGKQLRDVYVEEHGCFYHIFDKDGKYLFKKKKGAQGLKVFRKDEKTLTLEKSKYDKGFAKT